MTIRPPIRKTQRLESFMIKLYVIYNAPVSNFAMPHIQITSFSSFKYIGFNMDYHAGYLIGETREIFSLGTPVP